MFYVDICKLYKCQTTMLYKDRGVFIVLVYPYAFSLSFTLDSEHVLLVYIKDMFEKWSQPALGHACRRFL